MEKIKTPLLLMITNKSGLLIVCVCISGQILL